MATAAVTNTLVDGATIAASEHNTNYGDLVSFLNSSVLHLDGSKTMTGDLAMGSNKITGVAAPTESADAARKAETDANAASIASKIGASGVTYENLDANGDIGVGAAQVPQGNHAHDEAQYMRAASSRATPAALTSSWVTQVSLSLAMPTGWDGAHVIAWGEIQYGACPNGLQVNARVTVDTTIGATSQSGSSDSSDGASGVVSAAAAAAATTTEATINITLDAYATVATGGTGKYAMLNYIMFRQEASGAV